MISSDVIDGDFFESFGNGDSIVYSDILYVDKAFQTDKNHDILITHNGDINITEELYQKFKSCGRFKRWFAQNVCCKHDDLTCLPIGFERRRWCKFNKYDVMTKCKKNFTTRPQQTLYANFSIITNCVKRMACAESFINKQYCTNRIQRSTPYVKELTVEQYENFCNDILEHKFVLCPEGNGLDTHRFWEVLYLGRIPVALHNPTNDSFSDMPILLLDKWEDFEKHIDDEITGSYEKLNCEYWRKLINGDD